MLSEMKEIQLSRLTNLEAKQQDILTRLATLKSENKKVTAVRMNFIQKYITKKKEYKGQQEKAEEISREMIKLEMASMEMRVSISKFKFEDLERIKSATTLGDLGVTYAQACECLKKMELILKKHLVLKELKLIQNAVF